MDEVKKYAPVIIPTLNRYEHFKRCLESLEKCSYANQTDVYVGLDFPPAEKYREGWSKIDNYLRNKERDNGFAKLIVLRREFNYGLRGNNSNLSDLLRKAGESSNRYIVSEDDNEFAPNFLEYINWGLDFFENNNDVLYICGYTYPNLDFLSNNVFLSKRYSGWGFGGWSNKKKNVARNWEEIKQALDRYPFTTLFSNNIYKAGLLLGMLAEGMMWGDALIELIPGNWACLYPKISKVRNWGHDGSGLHSGAISNSKYKNIPFDTEYHFSPIIEGDLFDPRVEKSYQSFNKRNLKQKIKPRIQFILYKFFGRVIHHEKNTPWLKIQLRKVR